jgi:hypothetical protein
VRGRRAWPRPRTSRATYAGDRCREARPGAVDA